MWSLAATRRWPMPAGRTATSPACRVTVRPRRAPKLNVIPPRGRAQTPRGAAARAYAGREEGDAAGVKGDGAAAAAAELDRDPAAGEAQHLMGRRMEVPEGVDPVTPRGAPPLAGEGLLEHGGRIERLVERQRTAIDDQRQGAVGGLAVVTEAKELGHARPRQAGELAPPRPADAGQLLDDALQLFDHGHAGNSLDSGNAAEAGRLHPDRSRAQRLPRAQSK